VAPILKRIDDDDLHWFTVNQNVAKTGFNLVSVSEASPTPPPVGGHPWNGLTGMSSLPNNDNKL
jgi:hypothetical protein